MKTRVIELSVNNRKEVIELPINPPSVEFTEKQLNQAITLLNIGEANLKGERGLKYTKLSSFFPSEKSPFYKNAKKKPDKYVAMLQEWKTTKAVVRVIISDMKINLAMLIDDFTYSMREGDGDIYYTISFSEYRTLNVPSVQITTKVRNNGLLSRPAPAAAGGSYTVVGGDTLWGISKQKYVMEVHILKFIMQTMEQLRQVLKSMESPVLIMDTGFIRAMCTQFRHRWC